MTELLAPAGSYDAFIAAVSNGADAIYLGLEKYGARAYAKNFTLENLKEAIIYAHLRNVKVYITINTIIFDSEFSDVFSMIDELYVIDVDGVIAQDLALIDYIKNKYPNLEIHASTQMGIDDVDGVNFLKHFSISRVVLSRETSYEKALLIKKETSMPVELFIHGALCVSYSGNCLMSGLIGDRSGNRGRCVSSCRKQYELVDETNSKSYGKNYFLSMKELNTSSYIEKLKQIDSLKIEGRMKDAYYVANIVKSYRKLLDDSNANLEEIQSDLSKTMNRVYTKGFIFNEDKGTIVNLNKPNHSGEFIGKVKLINRNKKTLSLFHPVNQFDNIMILSSEEEILVPLSKLYDKDMNLINHAEKECVIEIKENVNIGDKIYRVKDSKYENLLKNDLKKEFKRLKISFFLEAHIGSVMRLSACYEDFYVTVSSEQTLEKSNNSLETYDNIFNQLNRLNDTPYVLEKLEIDSDYSSFIPKSVLNDLRRKVIMSLNDSRLYREKKINDDIIFAPDNNRVPSSLNINVYCESEEQYKACIDMGIKNIYYKNYVERNDAIYKEFSSEVLVGGYGGINHYKKQNDVIGDYSLNVVNSRSVYLLHNMFNLKRITLSHEISKNQIINLLDCYKKNYKSIPNLELIVYGKAHLMGMKYCPLKSLNLCGKCKTNKYILKDDVSFFNILVKDDCRIEILNGKILNLIDDFLIFKNIKNFRIQFTVESYLESKTIIKKFLDKIDDPTKSFFDSMTDTRGNFNKDII